MQMNPLIFAKMHERPGDSGDTANILRRHDKANRTKPTQRDMSFSLDTGVNVCFQYFR